MIATFRMFWHAIFDMLSAESILYFDQKYSIGTKKMAQVAFVLLKSD